MHCTAHILVLTDLPESINSLTCNQTTECLTYKFSTLYKHTQARGTYMSEKRLLSESTDQSFGIHLTQPQDIQRTSI